jgi:microcystin-dependent protein
MSDPFYGEIRFFGFSYAPRNWAVCGGQLMPVAQNEALFSLIGNTYGGDGYQTFGLPNLKGRGAVGRGQGPGTSNYRLGGNYGQEQFVLATANLPAHSHDLARASSPVSVMASTADAGSDTAGADSYFAKSRSSTAPPISVEIYGSGDSPNVSMTRAAQLSGQTGSVGSAVAVNNLQPYLPLNPCICTAGIYPARPT